MWKYPRTRHVEGSRLQPGDEDLAAAPFAELAAHHLVIEEKVDGANAAVSFAPDGTLLLQSRGHYLTGGGRERHFDLFKTWAQARRDALHSALSDRYVLYGEWVYAKHTVYYDLLPHYFLEFDVLDTTSGRFLSTARRRELLRGLPIASVPVLHEGAMRSMKQMLGLIGPSNYKSRDWRDRLDESGRALGLDVDRIRRETDPSDQMEGLYIKIEEDGCVQARYKYVRAGFLQVVFSSESHWLARPIVPNRLRDDVDLFT